MVNIISILIYYNIMESFCLDYTVLCITLHKNCSHSIYMNHCLNDDSLIFWLCTLVLQILPIPRVLLIKGGTSLMTMKCMISQNQIPGYVQRSSTNILHTEPHNVCLGFHPRDFQFLLRYAKQMYAKLNVLLV